MVKVDLSDEEIQALHVLMNDAKVPVELGFILGMMKRKIVDAYQKEQGKNDKSKKN